MRGKSGKGEKKGPSSACWSINLASSSAETILVRSTSFSEAEKAPLVVVKEEPLEVAEENVVVDRRVGVVEKRIVLVKDDSSNIDNSIDGDEVDDDGDDESGSTQSLVINDISLDEVEIEEVFARDDGSSAERAFSRDDSVANSSASHANSHSPSHERERDDANDDATSPSAVSIVRLASASKYPDLGASGVPLVAAGRSPGRVQPPSPPSSPPAAARPPGGPR